MSFNHRKTVTHRLSQAARATRAFTGTHLASVGLHPGQEAVLKALTESDGQTMSELAMALSVQPPTVTKMVTRLAREGHVERRVSKGDGRQAMVFLTDHGRDTVAAVDRIMKRVEKKALAGFDDDDRGRLRKMLRRVEKNLGASANAAEDAELSDISIS